jgi:hypothetical protein
MQMVAWEIVFPIGIIILGLGIGFSIWQYKRRDRSKTKLGDAVVRDRYQHPEKWDGGDS